MLEVASKSHKKKVPESSILWEDTLVHVWVTGGDGRVLNTEPPRLRRFFGIKLELRSLQTSYYALGDADWARIHRKRPKNEVCGPRNTQDRDGVIFWQGLTNLSFFLSRLMDSVKQKLSVDIITKRSKWGPDMTREPRGPVGMHSSRVF